MDQSGDEISQEKETVLDLIHHAGATRLIRFKLSVGNKVNNNHLIRFNSMKDSTNSNSLYQVWHPINSSRQIIFETKHVEALRNESSTAVAYYLYPASLGHLMIILVSTREGCQNRWIKLGAAAKICSYFKRREKFLSLGSNLLPVVP